MTPSNSNTAQAKLCQNGFAFLRAWLTRSKQAYSGCSLQSAASLKKSNQQYIHYRTTQTLLVDAHIRPPSSHPRHPPRPSAPYASPPTYIQHSPQTTPCDRKVTTTMPYTPLAGLLCIYSCHMPNTNMRNNKQTETSPQNGSALHCIAHSYPARRITRLTRQACIWVAHVHTCCRQALSVVC